MLTTTQSYVNYQGNGSTTQFPFAFYVQAAAHLVVTLTNNNVNPPQSSVLSALQYTLAFNANNLGGQLTAVSGANPLPSGWSLTIQRIVPYQQNTSLTNQGAFYPQVVESALDYLTMLVQQIAAGTTSTSPVLPAWISGLNTLKDTNGLVNSATPSLASLAPVYKTANTSSTTITDFTNKVSGHYFKVVFGDGGNGSPNTTIKFSGNGNIRGNNSQDWTPQVNDFMDCVTDGINVYCITSGTLASLQNYISTQIASIAPSNRNRFINGEMRIDQRNVGALQIITAGGAVQYTVDRWFAGTTGGALTGQQMTSGAPWKNYYRLSGGAGNTSFQFGQRIESINIMDLAGASVTFSAYLCSSTLSFITWTAYYPNALDNYAGQTQIATGTFNITSVLTRYSAQISLPANAINGVAIVFSGTNFTSGTLSITGCQLEPGTTLTAYERKPDDVELLRCKRYLPGWTWGASGYGAFWWAQPFNTTVMGINVVFSVPARATPTGVIQSGTTQALTFADLNYGSMGTNYTLTDPNSGVYMSTNGGKVFANGGSGFTGAATIYSIVYTSAGYILFTGCEL